MTQPFKKLRGLTGMHDVLPDQSAQWEQLEKIVREWLASYGYRNMRTPILEYTQLRSEEHTSELQSRGHLVCRLLLEKKKKKKTKKTHRRTARPPASSEKDR